jgi:Tol biopolymer transport system component
LLLALEFNGLLVPLPNGFAIISLYGRQNTTNRWRGSTARTASVPAATIFVRDAKGKHPLVPGFAASADSAVSFDGQRVLFAGKLKVDDPWQIWEIALAGGEPRRITSGSEDCVRPLYLPEDRVVYAQKLPGDSSIEAWSLAGGNPLPLTYGLANFLPDRCSPRWTHLVEASISARSRCRP